MCVWYLPSKGRWPCNEIITGRGRKMIMRQNITCLPALMWWCNRLDGTQRTTVVHYPIFFCHRQSDRYFYFSWCSHKRLSNKTTSLFFVSCDRLRPPRLSSQQRQIIIYDNYLFAQRTNRFFLLGARLGRSAGNVPRFSFLTNQQSEKHYLFFCCYFCLTKQTIKANEIDNEKQIEQK